MTEDERRAIALLGNMTPDRDPTKDNRPPSERLRGRERKVSQLNATYLADLGHGPDTGGELQKLDAVFSNTIAAAIRPYREQNDELRARLHVLEEENRRLRDRLGEGGR